MGQIDFDLVIAIGFALFILYLLARLLFYPFRALFKLLIQVGMGVVLLIIFNLAASFWEFSLGVNPFNALIVGFLGVPGLVLLVLLNIII